MDVKSSHGLIYLLLKETAKPLSMSNAKSIESCKTAYRTSRQGSVIDLDKVPGKKSTYQIHRLETLVSEFNGFIPPNRRSDFMISFVKKASGKRTIGSMRFPLQNNLLSVVPSRAVMSSAYESLDATGYVLTFNINFFIQNRFPYHLISNKKALKISVKPFVLLDGMQALKIEQLFENILEEQDALLPQWEEMVVINILELLIHCDRYFNFNQEQAGFNRILYRFDQELERYFAKQRSVSFYSSLLNLHANYLNRHVKKLTGLTAKQTIDNRVILEAKYLLYSSALSIKEIAYELGFEDPNYFISFFKKAEGTSPAQFRRDRA